MADIKKEWDDNDISQIKTIGMLQNIISVFTGKKETKARFFLDAYDGLSVPPNKLIPVAKYLHNRFGEEIDRIGLYGSSMSAERYWSLDALKELRKYGVKIIYMGAESGDTETLKLANKGLKNGKHLATKEQIIKEGKKIREAEIKLSMMYLAGLGGSRLSSRHATESADAFNQIRPEYLATLTCIFAPHTKYIQKFRQGEIDILDTVDCLKELELLINNLELNGTIFRASHVSNKLRLKGTLSQDKQNLLKQIRGVLEHSAEIEELESPDAASFIFSGGANFFTPNSFIRSTAHGLNDRTLEEAIKIFFGGF